MMSCWVLYNQTLVLLNTLQDVGLLNGPLADVCPLFGGFGIFFLCMGGFPPRVPIICELFEEVGFDIGRLSNISTCSYIK